MRGEDTISARSYKDAGVDIDAGAALIETIRPLAESTTRPGVAGALGGFGGLFDLAAAGFQDPILVAATDGVGTKLKLAAAAGTHQGIGVDLVAMCVNDLVVQGAEPLFFLDYFATGTLQTDVAAEVVTGIADGCRQAGCALIGGETAEMPGMYASGEYDVAGFAVGAAERDGLLTGTAVAAGDVVLGLASAGAHANGFSLVRQVVQESGAELDEPAPFAPETSLGAALLTPTRIYVAACLAALKATPGGVHAFAHITGGGLSENIPRVLPESLAVALDGTTWNASPVFAWLAENGIASEEMARTFNCGIGMIVICAPVAAGAVTAALAAAGETVYAIGHVTKRAAGAPAVQIAGLEAAWQN